MTDLRDRLIDLLLWEEMGGEKPPDLRQRVVARAMGSRRWLRPALLATAAAVLLGFMGWLGWLIFRPGYPEPQATGHYEVSSSNGLRRGATMRTTTHPARLELGGYCRLEVQPASTLRIEGDKHAEQVFLETGALECAIERGAGSFAVQTPIGTVSVVGTKFRVHLGAEEGEPEMHRKMVVNVLAGAVLVSGAWGLVQLHEGQQQAFAQEKKDKGTKEEKKGVTVGLLVEKSKEAIFVRADGEEKPRRFVPQWVGGAPAKGGGFDKHMLHTFHDLKVGSRLEVHWVFAERLRAVKINVLKGADGHAPEPGKKETAQPKTGDKRTGTTVGTLTARENNKWLEVKADGEEKARKYMMHAKLPTKLLQAAHHAAIGSRVSIEWVFTNHGPMVQKVEVVGKGSKD